MPASVCHVCTNTVADGIYAVGCGESEVVYHASSGVFVWSKLPAACHIRSVGDIAGAIDTTGYVKIMLQGRKYKAHRLAIFALTGMWADQVDHINGDRKDNRAENLRSVTALENAKNAKKRKDSRTKVNGVAFVERLGKWRVRINHNSQTLYLGLYLTEEEAIDVRLRYEKILGYSLRHGTELCLSQ